jgi:hypothetical protein
MCVASVRIALRGRRNKDDLVFLGDRRDRWRLGGGQGAGQEVDIVLDDQLAREPHRLIGAGFAVARQDFELAPEDAALGVDLGDRQLGTFQNRLAIDCGRSGHGDRESDFDRFRGDGRQRGKMLRRRRPAPRYDDGTCRRLRSLFELGCSTHTPWWLDAAAAVKRATLRLFA